MKGKWARLLVLLWLGWYASGPLAATFDYWDTPVQEISDLAHSAGGLMVLLGASVAFMLAQGRELRNRWRSANLRATCRAALRATLRPTLPNFASVEVLHSLPPPLRI